jgi:hypothetical protein
MKARPILFSGAMVRALLDGRKTQTRRVVKPQPVVTDEEAAVLPQAWEDGFIPIPCPHGKPGDLLWVRESFAVPFRHDPGTTGRAGGAIYRADAGIDHQWSADTKKTWTPSIHMDRWASRLTLEITGVRVERLQQISEADAVAEGCRGQIDGGLICPSEQYGELWSSINGQDSWDANPWVWVIEFKVHSANVDDFLRKKGGNHG